jgi:hypothetical protein
MRSIGVGLVIALGALLAPAAAQACDPWSASFRGDVPTAREVIGIDLGERDVTTAESDAYLLAVDRASHRVTSGVLATSVQGRPLRYAIVGDDVSRRGLEDVREAAEELMDPDTSWRRAERIAERDPAILWIASNVHGGEESGTDAALRVLYELADRRDCAAREILDEAIVVILPIQNPDGREADTRRNAYGFDMNRDWFARTQPETDGKVEFIRRYPPVLFIDAHEMGNQAGYFFPPNADPIYHETHDDAVEWINDVYGAAMQEEFTRRGIPFFNYNVYDLFYAGYGDTVPAQGFGAAGMTFEKTSSHPAPRRVEEQYITQWLSLTRAADRKERILRQWHRSWVDAERQGEDGRLEPNMVVEPGNTVQQPVPDIRVRHYFLRADEPGKAREVQALVRRLQRMDVEVRRLTRPLRVDDFTPYGRSARATTLPAGTYWVPMAQRQKHWVQSMLNENTYTPVGYAYDVVGWSNALLFNVDGGYSGQRLWPRSERVWPVRDPGPPALPSDPPTVALFSMSPEFVRGIESSGWLRWLLDQWRLPYRELTAADIAAGGLEGADVLLVPDGWALQDPNFPEDPYGYDDLGPAGRQAVVDWVNEGGRYVGWHDGAVLAAALGLSSAQFTLGEDEGFSTPGSLFRAAADADSPLNEGVGRFAWVMHDARYVMRTSNEDAVALGFPPAGSEDFFMSGEADGEAALSGSAAVIDEAVGAGRTVAFGFELNFRAYTDGTQRMLWNAVFGPNPAAEAPLARTARAAAAARQLRVVREPVRLVVRPRGAAAARRLVSAEGVPYHVVRARGRVTFMIANPGDATGDEHPFADRLAMRLRAANVPVVLYRAP